MKKQWVTLLLCCALFAGCESTRSIENAGTTDYGQQPCVGVFEKRDPRFVYRLSIRNVVMGSLFVETFFVPIIVIVNETFCPVAIKGEI